MRSCYLVAERRDKLADGVLRPF